MPLDRVDAINIVRGAPHAYVVVAASGARAKVKLTADWLCDGTADHVQLQAAVDAVSAAGGGKVLLTAGTYNLGRAAGQETANGTGALTADGTRADLAVGANVSKFAAGDLVRLSGANIAAKELDGIWPVYSVQVGAETIKLELDAPSIADVSYDLLNYSLLLPANVHLVGEGPFETKLALQADAAGPGASTSCDAIHFQATVASGANLLRDLAIDGDKANQSCNAGLSNGVVLNHNAMDWRFNNVFVQDFKGDGIVNTHCWGMMMTDSLVEWCTLNGLCLTNLGSAKVQNCKLIENVLANVCLTLTNRNLFTGCEVGTGSVQSAWGLEIRVSSANIFSAGYVNADGIGSGGVRVTGASGIGTSDGNRITDSNMRVSAGKTGVEFVAYTAANFIDLRMTGSGTPVVEPVGTNNANTIRLTGSSLSREMYLSEFGRYKNDSGAGMGGFRPVVLKAANSAEGDEIVFSATLGDPRVVGVGEVDTITDGNYGWIRTRGKATCQVDPGAGGGEIAIGDGLTCDASGNGFAVKAAAGNTVFAVALAARTAVEGQGAIAVRILQRFYLA